MLSGDYSAGAERGPWIGAYRNGQHRFAGNYADGNPVGEWTSWKDDGSVLSKGSYATGGKKVGTWTYFDTNPAGESVTYDPAKSP
jgi:antitoxin component YwqK of YwqJK toxin-antitoxin module